MNKEAPDDYKKSQKWFFEKKIIKCLALKNIRQINFKN